MTSIIFDQGAAGAAAWAVSETPTVLVKGTTTASASGDNTIYTPAAGKAIRLWFFGYSGGANVTGVLASLKLEGFSGGATIDQQYLIAAGQPYARNIKAGAAYVQGSVNGRLIVSLGAAQTVYVNYELLEI